MTTAHPDHPDHPVCFSARCTEPVVTLDLDQTDDLTHLLARIQDWLRHAGSDALDDLAEFLNGPGNGRLAAAGLIDLLAVHTAALHRRLKETS